MSPVRRRTSVSRGEIRRMLVASELPGWPRTSLPEAASSTNSRSSFGPLLCREPFLQSFVALGSSLRRCVYKLCKSGHSRYEEAREPEMDKELILWLETCQFAQGTAQILRSVTASEEAWPRERGDIFKRGSDALLKG